MEEDRKEHQDLEDRIRTELGTLEVNLTVEIPGHDVVEIGTFDVESNGIIEEIRERCHEVADSVLPYADKKNARLNANFSFSKDRRAYLHMHVRLFEFREFFKDHVELMDKIEAVFGKVVKPNEDIDEVAAYLESQ